MLELDWVKRVLAARYDVHSVMAEHETSRSRVVMLSKLLDQLSGAPVDVQDYFREAIVCLEHGLYRAGVVLSWAGQFHVFSYKLLSSRESAVKAARPNWVFNDHTELLEAQSEYQILEVAKATKFINRATCRMMNGQLAQRNQCAHATLYRPSKNAAIGFVDQMIEQTKQFL